jgi:hypothetical protein
MGGEIVDDDKWLCMKMKIVCQGERLSGGSGGANEGGKPRK